MDDFLDITVPNLGEGVRYVTVKRILRANGDFVKEDESLIEVETDKAVVEIPSPVNGRVSNLECKPGDVLPVGSKLLVIKNGADKTENTNFLKVDQKRKKDSLQHSHVKDESIPERSALSDRQRSLAQSMKRSASIVVPATIERDLNWDHIDYIKKEFRGRGEVIVPSSIEIICWSLARSIEKFEKFRIRMEDDYSLILSDKVTLGIAVANDGDDLSHEVVSIDSDDDIRIFAKSFRSSRERKAFGYHSVSVSDMSSLGAHRAIPVVVHPSVATFFIGSPQDVFRKDGWHREACVAITFDHRVMNGAYVAAFLKDLESNIKSYAKSLGR